MSSVITESIDLINRANKIGIIGHVAPDGDVVGSMLALGKALGKIGKTYRLLSPDSLPTFLSFLPGFTEVVSDPAQLTDVDLIIALDSSDYSRFGGVYTANPHLFHSKVILNIDHHVTNQRFGQVNWVDSEAAATSEQIHMMLKEMDVALDLSIATCLLTGIVTDTRCFRTSNTTPRTMTIATELMQAGAPLSQIADWVYNTKKLSTLQLWVRVLGTLGSSGGVVWAEVTMAMLDEVGALYEETDDLVSLIGGVREAKLALLFKEHDEATVKVSMRSNGEVNAAVAAAHFGGGGHPRAAGCTLKGTMVEAKEHMLAYLRRFMSEATTESATKPS